MEVVAVRAVTGALQQTAPAWRDEGVEKSLRAIACNGFITYFTDFVKRESLGKYAEDHLPAHELARATDVA